MATPSSSDGADARPLLLFIHGGFCDRRDWDGVIARLGSHHDAVSVDLPGHGASPPSDPASIAAFAEAVDEVRRTHGELRTILIAHSAGCRVALESVHRDGDNVIGLVLVDGGQLLGEGDPATAVRALSEALDQVGFTEMMRIGFEQAAASANEDDRRRILTRVLAHDPRHGREFLLSAAAWDAGRAASALAEISAPILVVQATGSTDPQLATPSPWSELVLANASHAQLCYLSSGHFVMLEQPEKLCELIARFAADTAKDMAVSESQT